MGKGKRESLHIAPRERGNTEKGRAGQRMGVRERDKKGELKGGGRKKEGSPKCLHYIGKSFSGRASPAPWLESSGQRYGSHALSQVGAEGCWRTWRQVYCGMLNMDLSCLS